MAVITQSLDDALAVIGDGCMLAVPREVSGVSMEATRALIRRGVKRLHLIALPTSSLYFKVAYEKQLTQMQPPLTAEQKPEYRWMVDPDDYLKPMVYDPKDARWAKGKKGHDRDDD